MFSFSVFFTYDDLKSNNEILTLSDDECKGYGTSKSPQGEDLAAKVPKAYDVCVACTDIHIL